MTNRHSRRSRGRGNSSPAPNHDKYGRPKPSAIRIMNENSKLMNEGLEELSKLEGEDDDRNSQ